MEIDNRGGVGRLNQFEEETEGRKVNGQEMSRVQSSGAGGKKGGASRDIGGYRYVMANDRTRRGFSSMMSNGIKKNG